METLANEFVNLPIIVSDYDAILKPSSPLSPISPTTSTTSKLDTTVSAASSTTTSPIHQDSTTGTGFTDFADELWSRMTHGMRQKLREACVEVLKRTDDASEDEKVRWDWDEDARFLD